MGKKLDIKNINCFIFDFDGVLTNNYVYLNELGKESVACNRADGISFNILKKINPKIFIISSEKNDVVKLRAKKLGLRCYNNVLDKSNFILKLSKKENFDLKKTFYVGNDINDYLAMRLCGYSACPSDSSKEIKKIAKFKLKAKGGESIVREILDRILDINILKSYNSK